MTRRDAGDPAADPVGDSCGDTAGLLVTWPRVCAWYRSTPRSRGIVLTAAAMFVAGWAWNMSGLQR